MGFFDTKAYAENYLDVGDGHEMFYELSGNFEGVPVLYLHGGPGACSMPRHKSLFDPKKYHVITYDQRGCGKSKPSGLIKSNAAQDLIADIEKLRVHLNVEKWVVAGGSWGSTLALLYAQSFPERVMALGASGVFLGRKREIEWLYHSKGVAKIFPEDWQEFVDLVGEENAKDPLPYMYEILNNRAYEDVKTISRAFVAREDKLCGMEYNLKLEAEKKLEKGKSLSAAERDALDEAEFKEFYLYAKIVVHYMLNGLFIDENQILNNMHKIVHIPLYIMQGRYDMVCPYESAYELHRAHPKSVFIKGVNAGHSLIEMKDELLKVYNEDIYNIVKNFKFV